MENFIEAAAKDCILQMKKPTVRENQYIRSVTHFLEYCSRQAVAVSFLGTKDITPASEDKKEEPS